MPEIHVPGKARDEEIVLRLRQGQSFLDMESPLRKTASFIAREANRILGKNEVDKILRQNKRGQWSSSEIQNLIALREQGLLLTKISKCLRRTIQSVEKQLRELRSTLLVLDVVEGPQELPPGLQESLFNIRLAEIWQALLNSNMKETWREALREKSAEEWLSRVSAGIPEHVKKILGALRPPT
jgi:hypothetical protein